MKIFAKKSQNEFQIKTNHNKSHFCKNRIFVKPQNKKILQKKAPLERFFYQTFFQICKMDIFKMCKIEISKNFWKKNRSKGAFFWILFLDPFFTKISI